MVAAPALAGAVLSRAGCAARLLDGYRGYLMTDATPATTPWLHATASNAWAAGRMRDASSVEAQKVQPKGKTGRADVALSLINKLYGIERDLKDAAIANASTSASNAASP